VTSRAAVKPNTGTVPLRVCVIAADASQARKLRDML